MWTAKCNSPLLSTDFGSEIFSDLPTGSTENHPRPDIAISEAGLLQEKIKEFHTQIYGSVKGHLRQEQHPKFELKPSEGKAPGKGCHNIIQGANKKI